MSTQSLAPWEGREETVPLVLLAFLPAVVHSVLSKYLVWGRLQVQQGRATTPGWWTGPSSGMSCAVCPPLQGQAVSEKKKKKP